MLNRKIFFSLLTTSLLTGQGHAAGYDTRGDIYDFLVQDVCAVGSAGGPVDQSRLPHQCQIRRNMRPDDPFYYRTIGLVNSPSRKFAQGKFAWSSYPVVENGVRRIMLMKDNGTLDGGTDDVKFGQLDEGDGISIRWMETSARGAAGMYFSVSPGGGAVGIEADSCQAFGKNDPRRYIRNWTTAPKDVDGMGWNRIWGHSQRIDSVESNNPLLFPHKPKITLPGDGDCAKSNFNHVFALATRARSFRYVNGAGLESIIHQKFSVGDSLSLGPTKARAFERIYLTRQYGVTRWETWKREDHHELTVENSVKVMKSLTAQSELGAPVCSIPYDLDESEKSRVNFKTRPLKKDARGYYQEYQDPTQGSKFYKFYLTACVDLTGRILTGQALNHLYQGRQNYRPSAIKLLKTFTDPAHRLDEIFFQAKDSEAPNKSAEPTRQPAGNFLLRDGRIFYSNGTTAFCALRNAQHYTATGGTTPLSDLQVRETLPSAMANHGICGGG